MYGKLSNDGSTVEFTSTMDETFVPNNPRQLGLFNAGNDVQVSAVLMPSERFESYSVITWRAGNNHEPEVICHTLAEARAEFMRQCLAVMPQE